MSARTTWRRLGVRVRPGVGAVWLAALTLGFGTSMAAEDVTGLLDSILQADEPQVGDMLPVVPPKAPPPADATPPASAPEPRPAEPPAIRPIQSVVSAERIAALRSLGLPPVLFVGRWKHLSLPANWQNLSARGPTPAALCRLDPNTGACEELYRTDQGIHDLDLHWDAGKVLFASRRPGGAWAVWEYDLHARGEPRMVTPAEPSDVHWFDPCYLADGRIVLASTAAFQGVPCVGSRDFTCNLYLLDPATGAIRQLTFDQEQTWNPVLREDGMVMYTRWEYMDTPHPPNRLIFAMRPDGSMQRAVLGSNQMWPTSTFQARPIPGQPNRFAAVASGHHGATRFGDLVLFDVGRDKAEGRAAVGVFADPQRRTGYTPPEGDTVNFDYGLTSGGFLFPWPLDGERFLVSKRGANSFELALAIRRQGMPDRLVDIFGQAGVHCLEPVPLAPRVRPPRIPDSVDLRRDHGVVMVADVYRGPGLAGVPRGTIKALRLIEPYYAPKGLYRVPGLAGPWDMRRIVGTVPVEADGSAAWKAPANVPLAIHALDAQGQAVAIMRSWYTAMPGERVTCLGCHEAPADAAPSGPLPLAGRRAPSTITPWRGPARGFAFMTEVQPVLDRHCVGCHDGRREERPDFASTDPVGPGGWGGPRVARSYQALQAFVRRPGPESNLALPRPMTWHADTSDLVQMLRKGHHGVKLDAESWDRLITWIDLNAPFHATWGDDPQQVHPSLKRRHELWSKYASARESMEVLPPRPKVAYVPPPPEPKKPEQELAVDGWPFTPEEAAARVARMSRASAPKPELALDLGGGIALRLVLIPAGSFVMGSRDGYDDEYPQAVVDIPGPFYLASAEISNAQYGRFDPTHDSGYFSQYGYFQSYRGLSARDPDQPVVAVSWERARAFCAWLGEQTGMLVDLPSEAEWEWACRAGSAEALWFGDLDQPWVEGGRRSDKPPTVPAPAVDEKPRPVIADAVLRDGELDLLPAGGESFPESLLDPPTPSRQARPRSARGAPAGTRAAAPSGIADGRALENLADRAMSALLTRDAAAVLFMPYDPSVNDKGAVSMPAAGYAANPFGLVHMHGNLREWTRSLYRPYPYAAGDGREDPHAEGRRVVRGGSFYDVPKRATASHRLGYRPWMQPWNVGFRVVCRPGGGTKVASRVHRSP